MLPPHKRSLIALLDELLMMLLAVADGAMLLFEIFGHLAANMITLIHGADLVIALIFIAEFTVRITLAGNKGLFLKKYWWELFAAIPVTSDITQALRLLRLIRLSRVFIHIRTAYRNHVEHAEEYRIT